MKVLGIIGSPRSRGKTYKITKVMIDEIKKSGIDAEIIFLNELNIEYCTGCTKCFREGYCPISDDVKSVHQKMLESDGVIFGAPAYALNVPAQAKAFIDRSCFLAHRPQFMGRYSVIISSSGAGIGENETAGYLKEFLHFMGFSCVGMVVSAAFGPTTVPLDKKTGAEAVYLGRVLAEAIREEPRQRRLKKNFKPSKKMRLVVERMGNYNKADYEFWKKKGWL